MSITEVVPADHDEVSTQAQHILSIIYEYRLTKQADAHSLWAIGTPRFLAVIERYVRENKTLRMCLPAFPWKSANKQQKALGVLPDKAEEVALTRLDEMCARISRIYKPGAKLLIISDGLVYNGQKPCCS
jgi:pyoverdine/dityrosine biosynthesis protein Dit1